MSAIAKEPAAERHQLWKPQDPVAEYLPLIWAPVLHGHGWWGDDEKRENNLLFWFWLYVY